MKSKAKNILLPVFAVILIFGAAGCSKLDKLNEKETGHALGQDDGERISSQFAGTDEFGILEDYTDGTDVSGSDESIDDTDIPVYIPVPGTSANVVEAQSETVSVIENSTMLTEASPYTEPAASTTRESKTDAPQTTEPATTKQNSNSSESYTLTLLVEKNGKTFKTLKGSTKYALPDDIPVKAGYIFKGWKSSADGLIYWQGDPVTLTANTVFIAQWQKTYVLTFDLNGGKGNFKRLAGKVTYQIPGDIPKKDGYHFYGWLSDADAKIYEPYETITLTKATTLIAQWGNESAKVSFNLSGGNGTFNSMTGSLMYTLPTNIPTRPGYAFNGWKSSADGKVYQPGEAINAPESVVLTAVWKKVCVLSFDLDGGVGTFQTMNNGTTYTIPSNTPIKPGYTFNGWKSSTDGKTYKAGEIINLSEDTVLTAQWKTAG